MARAGVVRALTERTQRFLTARFPLPPQDLLFVLRSLILCLLWLAGPAWAASPLIDAQALHALIAEEAVRLIDIREGPAYELQHVPTAVSAPYGLWHGEGDNPGLVPPLPELTELVQSLGLTPQTRTVIVYAGIDATDFGGAARVYWTLASLGLRELSILNGGLTAWVDAGFEPSDVAAVAERSDWQPVLNQQWMATREDVLAVLGDDDTLLVDARPPLYFEGRTKVPQIRALGTLPSAVNLDSELFFELGSAELMGADELADEADTLDVAPDHAIITFCNAGHWSATDWFVLNQLLGYADVRMYPGSMADWTNAPEPLPMAHEPGRLEQLRFMVMDWAHRNLGTRAP